MTREGIFVDKIYKRPKRQDEASKKLIELKAEEGDKN
jgi:hypothetical protein